MRILLLAALTASAIAAIPLTSASAGGPTGQRMHKPWAHAYHCVWRHHHCLRRH